MARIQTKALGLLGAGFHRSDIGTTSYRLGPRTKGVRKLIGCGLAELETCFRPWRRGPDARLSFVAQQLTVGSGDEDLDRQLEAGLDEFNSAATRGVPDQQKLTVRFDEARRLVAGASGWTWGVAAGISMTWVREDRRGTGLGARVLEAFEAEARRRGCAHIFVTSFTFQAPGFYQGLGYREFARWETVPVAGTDDVHMRKQL